MNFKKLNWLFCILGIILGSFKCLNRFDTSNKENLLKNESKDGVNFDYVNGGLELKDKSDILWNGPHFDNENAIFYLSIKRSQQGRLNNSKYKGITLWFIYEKENDNILKNLNENENETVFGKTKQFEGLGVKINELSLISVFKSNNTSADYSDFSENHSNRNKNKIIACDIPSEDYLHLRVTFLRGYVFLEYISENSNVSKNNFEDKDYKLCYSQELIKESSRNYNYRFTIFGDLKEEKTTFTFKELGISKFTNLKNKKNNVDLSDQFDTNANYSNLILSKIDTVSELANKIYNLQQINNNQFGSKLEQEISTLNNFIEEDIFLNQKSHNNTMNYNSEYNVNKIQNPNYIYELINTIKNLSNEKRSTHDPRENLIKSLELLSQRQKSMNGSIIEMYDSTLLALHAIKQKAEKMEVYQLFTQLLFFLIFINAVIIYFMYRGIKEQEEKEEVINSNYEKQNLRLAV